VNDGNIVIGGIKTIETPDGKNNGVVKNMKRGAIALGMRFAYRGKYGRQQTSAYLVATASKIKE